MIEHGSRFRGYFQQKGEEAKPLVSAQETPAVELRESVSPSISHSVHSTLARKDPDQRKFHHLQVREAHGAFRQQSSPLGVTSTRSSGTATASVNLRREKVEEEMRVQAPDHHKCLFHYSTLEPDPSSRATDDTGAASQRRKSALRRVFARALIFLCGRRA